MGYWKKIATNGKLYGDPVREAEIARKKSARRKKRKLKASYKKAATDFYNSREWKQLRYQALKLNGGKCQCCGAGRSDGAVIHVDHIKPRSKFPALQLVLTNLQVLCKPCNEGKSNLDYTDWR